jgi:RNA polymerase sigma-70 factor, ECF subfamily
MYLACRNRLDPQKYATVDSGQIERPAETSPGTLGDVLYAKPGRAARPEAEWVALVRAVGSGEQAALHALFERSHRLVFTLAMRITCCRETAEEVTLDVFHDIWRRAWGYDPANGTVLGWIMNQARSRSLDRLRFERRKKRIDPRTHDPADVAQAEDPRELLEVRERGAAVRAAVASLSAEERRAIESAFFAGLTHAEVAASLDEPLGTIKTRIRSALQKLRLAMDAERRQA